MGQVMAGVLKPSVADSSRTVYHQVAGFACLGGMSGRSQSFSVPPGRKTTSICWTDHLEVSVPDTCPFAFDLPSDLANRLEGAVPPGQRSAFIVEAIETALRTLERD